MPQPPLKGTELRGKQTLVPGAVYGTSGNASVSQIITTSTNVVPPASTPVKRMLVIQHMKGATPSAVGIQDTYSFVPWSPYDRTQTWQVKRRRWTFSLDVAGTTESMMRLQMSYAMPFDPIDLATLTIPAGSYEATTLLDMGVMSTGQVFRVYVDELGSGARRWFDRLECEEA